MGKEERDELSLNKAAALLGLSAEDLLDLLRDAGIRVEKGAEVRLQAKDVLALQREREKRRKRSMEELGRLSEAMGDEES